MHSSRRELFVSLATVVVLGAVMVWNMRGIERTFQAETGNIMVNPANVPPTLALTTFALGPLRGLIVDGLWWRMIQHQDSGNYFETMQLTEWITALQPRFDQVWAFNAWNLSYNVAQEFADPETRWKWIERSIRLLRDEGLKYNPGSEVIRLELARIFVDRIGSRGDIAQQIFKRNWARIVMQYLDVGNRAELERLQAILKTPPATTNSVAVAELTGKADRLGLDISTTSRILVIRNSATMTRMLIETEAERTIWRDLVDYARAVRLEKNLKLKVDRLLLIDREYGPFDWRLPQAHAVYWAAEDNFAGYLTANTQLSIMVRQAMVQSFHIGRLLYDQESGFFMATNNLAIVGKLHDYYAFLVENKVTPRADALHRKFLTEAIAILYSYNYRQAAHELFDHYAKDYPTPGKGLDFNAFVRDNMALVLRGETYYDARSTINAALFQAYFWLAAGDTRRALGYSAMSHNLWTRHQKASAGMARRLLPPFETMQKAAFKRVEQSRLAPFLKERLARYGVHMEGVKTDDKEDYIYLGAHLEDEHHEDADVRKNPRPVSAPAPGEP